MDISRYSFGIDGSVLLYAETRILTSTPAAINLCSCSFALASQGYLPARFCRKTLGK